MGACSRGRVRRGPAAGESLRLDPRYLQPWENLAPVECGLGGLTWKLVPPLFHELHALQQAVHLGLDVAQLGPEAVQLLGLDWGVGAEGAAAGTSKPTLPAEGLPAPHYPDSEACAPSLTLYLRGQLALPGGPVGTEAALGPRAQLGPPDPDRHPVEEGRDPLVFVHPVGIGQRESGHQPPLRPEARPAGPPTCRGHLPGVAHNPGCSCCCNRNGRGSLPRARVLA